jgi:uncharacterized Zn finger protein (UPF0148 family)
MDKYAVVLDDEKTKTAGTDNTCPKCGRTVEHMNDGFPHCPNCGTAPFEKIVEESFEKKP